MGALKNARHERFAQELAKGKSQVDAYAAAGFKPNRSHAARLVANGNISARIEELKEKAAEKAAITAADIAKQLDEDREFARQNTHSGAAVQATMGKAKVLGLIKDRHEHSGPNGGPIPYRELSDEEVEARIRAHETDAGRSATD
jgi:hypothetical protein